MKNLDKVTIIGKIIGTHGIKGELKVYPYTDSLKQFKKLNYVLLGDELEFINLSNVRVDNKFAYIKFENFNNINDVLKFKDFEIYINDEDKIELEEGRFYVSDLIGKDVYDTSSKYLGKLTEVMDNPANDIFVVKSGDDKYLIPAVKAFVKEISEEIIVELIEGMKL